MKIGYIPPQNQKSYEGNLSTYVSQNLSSLFELSKTKERKKSKISEKL
jgi:hypothetical protein